MILLRFLTFLSFLSILLSSSTTSALSCPEKISVQASNPTEEFVVFLNPPKISTQSIASFSKVHLDVLKKCLGRRVVNIENLSKEASVSGSNKKPDKNLIINYSVDGTIAAYSGFFNNDFVKNVLTKSDDVNFVEKAIKVKANYAVNQSIIIEENNLEKRTIQSNAPFNLDRIDQKDFPLDGKYKFPNNAGSDVNVYVIDSGIDIKNVEFEGRASHGGSFCFGCSSTDDNGHGTNVAGIIGGKNFGVAKKTKLIAVKVLDKNGNGSSITVIAGLSFVMLQHKKDNNKNTIINLSLGGEFSQAMNKMICECSALGIHVVASAGDSKGDACKSSPASAPQAITVGATEKFTNDITNTTNFGNCVDIFAPGRDIVAAGADLKTSLSKASGTSQACSHVSGTIALIISKKGNLKPSVMTNELITLSVKNILRNANAKPNRFLLVPAP